MSLTLHPARSLVVACRVLPAPRSFLYKPSAFSARPENLLGSGVHCRLFLSIFNPLSFSHLQIPFSASRLFSHLSETPGGGLSSTALASFRSSRSRLTNYNSRLFKSLRTLCRSFPSPVVSFQGFTDSFCKYRGVGPQPSRLPEGFSPHSPLATRHFWFCSRFAANHARMKKNAHPNCRF